LDKTEASNDQRIPTVLDELPAAIWLSFGDDLGKYIRQVRAHDQKRREAGIFPEHSTLVFVIVSSVEEALVAVNEWHSDVIIIQGKL
jgi:nitronate monooxygenase